MALPIFIGEKMAKHILSCSFGKDSIATALLALQHGEPLDELNPVVFLPTPHGLLPMKCTPEQYEQFQRDGNKLKIKPIDHGER